MIFFFIRVYYASHYFCSVIHAGKVCNILHFKINSRALTACLRTVFVCGCLGYANLKKSKQLKQNVDLTIL